MTNEEIKGILDYPETTLIEYKREEYPIEKKAPKKHEILKDISAMANHPNNSDKFIVIGMKDGKFHDIDSPTDDDYYQQYVKENVDPIINFEYRGLQYNGHKIAIFRIFNNNDRPYLIKNKIVNSEGKDIYSAGDGFIRRGTRSDRLLRKDFDRIYADKYVAKDRKDDLKALPRWKFIDHDEFYGTDCYSIDLDLENESNQSLDVTVELHIQKSNKYEIKTQDDIDRAEYERKLSERTLFESIPSHVMSFNATMYEIDNKYIIKRGLRPSIKIEQQEKITVFFNESVFLLGFLEGIAGEIVLKSDSFTGGPKIVPLTRPNTANQNL